MPTPSPTVPTVSPALELGREPKGWPVWGLLRAAGLTGPLITLTLGLAGLALGLTWPNSPAPTGPVQGLAFLFLLLSLGGLGLTGWRLGSRLLGPLAELEERVALVCQGEPGASGALRELGRSGGVLGPLALAIGALTEELADLYEDMDNRV